MAAPIKACKKSNSVGRFSLPVEFDFFIGVGMLSLENAVNSRFLCENLTTKYTKGTKKCSFSLLIVAATKCTLRHVFLWRCIGKAFG